MNLDWFKERRYRHFDVPVTDSYVKYCKSPSAVSTHSWLPLIHYEKKTKRYRPAERRTVFKPRPIMFASHRDACILSYYAWELNLLLNKFYVSRDLDANVLAYRRLGRANYAFAAEVQKFIYPRDRSIVLCFDISGFFDHLSHAILKERLRSILEPSEIPRDWYAVFRFVTKYRYVSLDDLKKNPIFGERMGHRSSAPIATIRELKEAAINIQENKKNYGIPQGTPISSAFSNLYMAEFDSQISEYCRARNALYRRYSDDIIIVCDHDDELALTNALKSAANNHKLEINDSKTERTAIVGSSKNRFQYLGFNISKSDAVIRPTSLARQWRKLKRSLKTTKRHGEEAIKNGTAKKIYTKKLRRRFSPVQTKNFSRYARLAASEFGGQSISRQLRKFERAADAAIRALNK